MTGPLVVFADPEGVEIDYLKAAFLPRSEAYKPATVSTSFPSATLVNATHVQVELEGGDARHYPVTERAQVRFTCHVPPVRRAGDTIGGRSDVKDLASLTQGLIYTQPGNNDVFGTRILVGRSDVVKDPDTGNLMVWFLAEVKMVAQVPA